MSSQNTIYNKTLVSSVKYNMRFGVDDPNNLDIFTKPTTDGATAQQISDFTYRSWNISSLIVDVNYCEVNARTVTYNNGTAGVGATVTNAGSATPLVIDGATVPLGATFALGGQASGAQNGLYTLTTAGNAWVGTRMTGYDSPAEILLGTFFNITDGNLLAGKKFVQVNANFATVGTSAIVFRTPGSVLMSSNNAVYFLGAYNMIATLAGDCFPTFPTGTYNVAAEGANVTFGTIASSSVTFNTGTGLKTGTTLGNTYSLSYYDTDAGVHRIYGTATAGLVPTFDLSPPAGGLVTITKSVGTGGTNIIPGGSLFFNGTPVSNVGAGEDTLMTNDLGASTLVTTNQYIEWETAGTNANNINSKVVKVYFGTTVVATITQPASVGGGWWRCKVSIIRTGLNTQAWLSEVTRITTGGGTVGANTSGTCAETETAAITMKCTGEAVADADLTQTKSVAKSFAG